jgi:hypothetical protein
VQAALAARSRCATIRRPRGSGPGRPSSRAVSIHVDQWGPTPLILLAGSIESDPIHRGTRIPKPDPGP